jgi:alkanesulfonate monooxygenase SsuD/methylene tetrahydromethanopterin reductase-like flavin-dependent oxidoreductase (luciferase family)
MRVKAAPSEVKFGVHLSGSGDPSAEAAMAESLGFDIVAIDRDVLDGPPPCLEMWTTLTWVAARTSTITVVPNVLALPNRHPALLAKMAGTLDRLAAGRFVLALGAGAPINDAGVHALGLPEWSPAERVEATAEAIDVIRGLWSENEFSYSGNYFTLDHASLQPRPERHIPIWLGAYKPRMLELAGRSADGWIPSLFLLEPDAAYRAREQVRAAAMQAGRDPDTLTNAYNLGVLIDAHAPPRPGQLVGSAEQVAETLAEFVTHGFTTFLFWLSGDPAAQMERIAGDAIRWVRELVNRGDNSTPGPGGTGGGSDPASSSKR